MFNVSYLPKVVVSGSCIGHLAEIIARENAKNVFLITDHGVKAAGLIDGVIAAIERSGAVCTVHDGIPAEPAYTDVQSVVDAAAQSDAELIIGVGGGSVMDTAKLCSLLSKKSVSVGDLLANPLAAGKGIPAVMIPTTCGTGSEATVNAIVAVPEKSIKVGIVNPAMLPDYVLLDSAMIARLPQKIVAATGVDALAHAVECFTSNKANHISDAYALASCRLIFSSLESAFLEPDNMEAKTNMLLGAFFGGAAITSSGTTAVHALSYPLGGKFHIPHGVSNAILFCPVMRFNCDAIADRLAIICGAISPERANLTIAGKAAYVIERIGEIVKRVQIPETLACFGVAATDIDFLVESAAGVTRLLSNNRKKLTKDDIRSIYNCVM